ncbi:MAG: TonB-dependent receptor [Candidatus Eremiobacteraeota bacterium]|nr:TonB-dependent receptor [Candidatus Eremiobacteraeota bacterium]
MMRSNRWYVAIIACLLATQWCSAAFAGTTGSLAGYVRDVATGAALAGATVTAVSPSQTASTTTDQSGHFVFLSLAPDTYTLTAQARAYQRLSVSGYAVFADQTQNVQLTLQKSLTEIGAVTSRSSLNPVKPGTITDVYSVSPTVQAAASPIGGGGGLNNAYSAIASMPGTFVPPGQMGVNQSAYIRGGYYDQIGYEYDGVPVNRSFDNYPGHSAASLGQQELEIYTGGGGVQTSATGLAGFINQVIKTGTYPGTGYLSTRIGAPTFYHDLLAEAGGATPNRMFSYYLGFDGYNQQFRYFDQSNGAGLLNEFPYPIGPSNLTTNLHFYPAVYPNCIGGGATDPFANGAIPSPPFYNDPGCFSTTSPIYSSVSGLAGREFVSNFHVGIPHKRDSGRDDVQLLFTSSAQFRQYYSGVNDAGPALIADLVKNGDINPPHWPDYVTFPGGTGFLAPAGGTPIIPYYFPGSPTQRCANQSLDFTNPLGGPFCAVDANGNEAFSPLPNDYRDGRWDTASVAKLQYQHNIGSNAYLRLLGYTFYSNTNRSGASRRGIGSGFGATNYDYEVDSHTRGAELQFADQLNEHHQLTGTFNYVTASTVRVNNFNYFNTPGQQVSNLTNGMQCFAYQSGYLDNGVDFVNAGDPAPCNDSNTQGTFDSPVPGLANPCPGPTPACQQHAQWGITYTGNQGPLNTVRPTFMSLALNDDWRPNDRLDINLGLRQDRFQFDLANTNTPGKNFWFAAAQREFCYNPVTLQPVFVPQAPQNVGLQIPYVTFNCPIDYSSGSPVQTVHPDGQNGHILLSNQYGSQIVQNVFQPRIGATYTVNPDTVFRFSAGRYVQQPQNYEIQYNSLEENLAAQLIGFFPYGFFTPRHDPLPQVSDNYDLSYERHFKGTDMAMKLTPYYRYASGQLYGISAAGSSASINTGIQKNLGVELQFTKGDFNRNGLSGLFSYTYLNSKEKWANFAGTNRNPVDIFNDYITQYNALTKAAGGARCYDYNSNAGPAPGVNPIIPDPNCIGGSKYPAILNPYYNNAPQPLFDRNGWYDSGLDVPWTSPNVFALVLNYRHNKLAITPAITLNEGTSYGAPSDVLGVDPRTCKSNLTSSGFTTGNPLAPDYTSCKAAATPSGNLYIPNPETGHFDGFGEFRQPWQLNAGLQISYDFNDKVRGNLMFTNLLNRCFGGSSTPWTQAYPPNSQVCGYIANTFYIANFYNGSGPNDVGANGVPLNPYFAHSFVPSYGDASSFNFPMPLNVYFQLQIKL